MAQAEAVGSDSARLPVGVPDEWVQTNDLPCPTCGYNLRMLHNPRCPECGSIFRWQALLHVTCPRCEAPLVNEDGAACPRCTLALDWKLLLNSSIAIDRHHYEYTNRPVQAAIRAMFQVLRPKRFWQNIRLESTPVQPRLRRLLFVAILTQLVAVFAVMLVNLRAARVGWPQIQELYAIWVLLLALPAITTLVLPRFTPTLRLFTIRRDQLLRCSTYAYVGLMWPASLITLIALTAMVGSLTGWLPTTGSSPYFSLESAFSLRNALLVLQFGSRASQIFVLMSWALLLVIAPFQLLWWWLFFFQSLHKYLRLDLKNAAAILASTAAISILITTVLLCFWDGFIHAVARVIRHLDLL